MRGLPSAMTRAARNRLALIAVALIGANAAAASNVAQAAHIRLADEVDANWRGVYDILVRPAGARLSLEQTDGLVEPNFLGFSGHGGITLDQVREVSQLPGVEVAAPVAMVGSMASDPVVPSIYIPEVPRQPTLYQLTITASTSDGIHEFVLSTRTARALLGPGEFSQNVTEFLGMNGDNASLIIDTAPLPALPSPLVAIDPAAEAELLGARGQFLAPLLEIGAGENPANLIPEKFAAARFSLSERRGKLVPLVVSDRIYSPLVLRLTVEQLGEPLARFPPGDRRVSDIMADAQEAAGRGRTIAGTSELDATGALRPFQIVGELTLRWPDSDGASSGIVAPATALTYTFESLLVERPTYEEADSFDGASAPAFRIRPLDTSETDERNYRDASAIKLAPVDELDEVGRYDNTLRPFVLIPVGEFSLESVNAEGNPLTHVPLGIYGPPTTTRFADATGTTLVPQELQPTFNPQGLLAVPPLAITNLESAVLLRGEAPIDAIRVRVAGVADYSPSSRAKVERVATRIADLGFDVDVVAGSSPADIDIYVPDYVVGAPSGADDLGWIRQPWTTLGAAERVEIGLTLANQVLLILAFATSVVVAVGLQTLQFATRVSEVSVLRAIGWSRREIVRWFAAEASVASVPIVIVTVAAWLASGSESVGLLAGLGLALIFPVSAIVAGLAAVRRAHAGGLGEDLWRGVPARIPVRGPISYGVRSALSRPARSVAILAPLTIAAAATGLAVSVVVDAAARVGPTRLAEALTATLHPYQLALLMLSALGGAVLLSITLALDLRARQGELRALSAAGWTPWHVLEMLAAQRALTAILAAVLAALVALQLAGPLGEVNQPAWAALVAALGAATLPVWSALIGLPTLRRQQA